MTSKSKRLTKHHKQDNRHRKKTMSIIELGVLSCAEAEATALYHEVSEMQTKLFGKRLLLFSPLRKRHIRHQKIFLNVIDSASKSHPFLPVQLLWRRQVRFLEKVTYPSVKQQLNETEMSPEILQSSKFSHEEKVRGHLALECSRPAFF